MMRLEKVVYLGCCVDGVIYGYCCEVWWYLWYLDGIEWNC